MKNLKKKMSIKAQPTILLQMCFEFMLNSKVILKSVIDLDEA